MTQPQSTCFSPLATFLSACEPRVIDTLEVEPRAQRLAKIPSCFGDGGVGDFLRKQSGSDNLWLHQAKALDLIDLGKHVVIATSTASGKSLPFQAAALRAVAQGRTVLVFYPLKALLNDQLGRWQKAAECAGLAPSIVAQVNGDVPGSERDDILRTAQIILLTPDVAHAWLMRSLSSPLVQRFLRSLAIVTIDEAHTFEGVFGSNCAFLFRRIRSAVARLKAELGEECSLQFIAATATIAQPVAHLEDLTGCSFEAVEEVDNGAPRYGFHILHVDAPAHGRPAEALLAAYAMALNNSPEASTYIAFADKRQGVERIAREIDRDDVMPYRSGYEPQDRLDIERSLHSGTLGGVVSTSALELGIDIPHFKIGLNLGVPISRKSALQRVGRVGRDAPGVFVFLAPADAFAAFGSSLEEFVTGEIESSHLYLRNRLIQYQQACCLRDECQTLPGEVQLPDNVVWPDGFEEAFAYSQPGFARPQDVDRLAMLGTGAPHLDYPLRHIAEPELAIRLARGGDLVGRITKDKAMREAFPGAVYLHCRTVYRVLGWKNTGYENTILVERVKVGAVIPKPMIETIVNVSNDPRDLIDDHLLIGSAGSIAETCVRVVETVFGYSVQGKAMPYCALRAQNANMRSKSREISSSGIVIRIDKPWFKGSGEAQLAARRKVALALSELLAREQGITRGEIRCVHTGIVRYESGAPHRLDDAIVIFDDVNGGLRLTAPLFQRIAEYIDRLSEAADRAGEGALLSNDVVSRLTEWYSTLQVGQSEAPTVSLAPEERLIFAPGSTVRVRIGRSIEERKLLAHEMMTLGGTEQLMYRYELSTDATGWVPHELVEPIGEGWRHVIWNPVSGVVRDIAA